MLQNYMKISLFTSCRMILALIVTVLFGQQIDSCSNDTDDHCFQSGGEVYDLRQTQLREAR